MTENKGRRWASRPLDREPGGVNHPSTPLMQMQHCKTGSQLGGFGCMLRWKSVPAGVQEVWCRYRSGEGQPLQTMPFCTKLHLCSSMGPACRVSEREQEAQGAPPMQREFTFFPPSLHWKTNPNGPEARRQPGWEGDRETMGNSRDVDPLACRLASTRDDERWRYHGATPAVALPDSNLLPTTASLQCSAMRQLATRE